MAARRPRTSDRHRHHKDRPSPARYDSADLAPDDGCNESNDGTDEQPERRKHVVPRLKRSLRAQGHLGGAKRDERDDKKGNVTENHTEDTPDHWLLLVGWIWAMNVAIYQQCRWRSKKEEGATGDFDTHVDIPIWTWLVTTFQKEESWAYHADNSLVAPRR